MQVAQAVPAGASRPPTGELGALVRLAAPVVVVQLGLMLMGVVDTLMLGRLSPAALAAGALGHVYSITFLIAGQGLLMALDPLVAQAWGAGDRDAVGRHLSHGVALALLITVPVTALMLHPAPALSALGQQAAIVPEATRYIRGVALGNAAFFLFVVLRQTLQAMSSVRPAVVAVAVGNLVNVAANYALIHGRLGLPRLEVLGAALATSLSRWVLVLALAWAARPVLAEHWRGLRGRELHPARHLPMVRLGAPIALHVSLELLVFVTSGLLIGTLGVAELAAHQVALNLASLSFMVPMGIAGAAATRVGNAIGAGDMPGARRAAATAVGLGVGAMACFALVFGLASDLLAGLYTTDPGVRALAASLIAIAAVFQVFDGTQVVSIGILRGAGDTRTPALVNLFGYWVVGLPLGAWLGLRLGMGPSGLWWGLTAGLAACALLLVARVRRRFRGRIGKLEMAGERRDQQAG